jgi:hypothetical protein
MAERKIGTLECFSGPWIARVNRDTACELCSEHLNNTAHTWPGGVQFFVLLNRGFVFFLPFLFKCCYRLRGKPGIRRLASAGCNKVVITKLTRGMKFAGRARCAVTSRITKNRALASWIGIVRTKTTVAKLVGARCTDDVMTMMASIVHQWTISASWTIFCAWLRKNAFFLSRGKKSFLSRSVFTTHSFGVLFLQETIIVALAFYNTFISETKYTGVTFLFRAVDGQEVPRQKTMLTKCKRAIRTLCSHVHLMPPSAAGTVCALSPWVLLLMMILKG